MLNKGNVLYNVRTEWLSKLKLSDFAEFSFCFKEIFMRKKFHNSYLAHFLLFNFFFLAYSLFSTLISVYMQDLGYSNAQVSMVVSASFFATMLAQPIFGVLSDALGIKKIFLFSFLVTL